MNPSRALLISLVVHAVLFGVLGSGIKFSNFLKQNAVIPIEARLVIKKHKNKDHLPRKSKAVPAPDQNEQEKDKEKAKEKKEHISEQPKEKIEKVAKTIKSSTTSSKKTPDYTTALASLSKSFAQELAESPPEEEPEGEVVADATFFDQVYTLIKESFVVPPHINGPHGRSLQTVLKLFLSSDGSLLRIDLVTPSGDEHFDKAVLEGTRRVDNFGLVPLTLQNMVRERGIVVELCPFTCQER